MKGTRNDIFIRAYDKCPAYLDALANLYANDSWKTLEDDHRPLLDNLGQVAEFQPYVNDEGYVPLSDVWNVFDLINVAKTECAAATTTNDTDCEFDPLDDDTWLELQTITHLAEFQRYSNTTAGDLLGGNLLLQIHQRMGGSTSGFSPGTNASDVKGFRKFFHYSAHYPTILSVFAALNVLPPSNEVIPGYSDALIFELYNDTETGVYSVNMLYKEADLPNATTVRFPEGPCQGASSCSLGDFTQLLSTMSFTSLEEWCGQCENESADVCLEVKLDALSPRDTTTASAGSATCSISVGPLIVALFGGIALGVLMYAIFQKVMTKKTAKDVDIEAIDPDKRISLDSSDIIIN
ncbi:acid phosphatase [Fragilaria crotonensis]|nr:acid phosphatase [Fragilaria crotonensis]